MLNFCSCLLDFFAPIFADSTKLQRIDLGYPTSGACRLNYDFETCLAGAQISMNIIVVVFVIIVVVILISLLLLLT